MRLASYLSRMQPSSPPGGAHEEVRLRGLVDDDAISERGEGGALLVHFLDPCRFIKGVTALAE